MGTAGGALYYKGFDRINAALETTLTPASGPETIGSGVAVKLTQGQPQWKPMNSSITCFNQKSIYYVCIANAEAVAVPISCKVSCHSRQTTMVVISVVQ